MFSCQIPMPSRAPRGEGCPRACHKPPPLGPCPEAMHTKQTTKHTLVHCADTCYHTVANGDPTMCVGNEKTLLWFDPNFKRSFIYAVINHVWWLPARPWAPTSSSILKTYHQHHMANNQSPCAILAEILPSGPTAVGIMGSPDQRPLLQLSPECGHVVACYQQEHLTWRPLSFNLLLLLMSYGNTTSISFNSASLISVFQASVCEFLAPAAATTAAPAPGAASCRAAQAVRAARTSSMIIVVTSVPQEHSLPIRDVVATAVAVEIIVVTLLDLEHLPSSRYETKQSTAIIV